MISSFSFWIWASIITQFLTALAHSMGFIMPMKPRNEQERQLIDINTKYKIDMGAGYKRTYYQLFIGVSVCFTIIYIFGAVLNLYLLRSATPGSLWEGLLLIEVATYGLIFLLQLRFTFLPPIILTGLVFLFLAGAYFLAELPAK